MAWSGAFGCLGKTHFFWIDEKVCLMNFKGLVISDKPTKRRKSRRVWQDHNCKIIGRVNQRVTAASSPSVVGINLDWPLLAALELPWILSKDFTALKDRPASQSDRSHPWMQASSTSEWPAVPHGGSHWGLTAWVGRWEGTSYSFYTSRWKWFSDTYFPTIFSRSRRKAFLIICNLINLVNCKIWQIITSIFKLCLF